MDISSLSGLLGFFVLAALLVAVGFVCSKTMQRAKQNMEKVPRFSLITLIFSYGLALFIFVGALFWGLSWLHLMFIVVACLVFVAPILMLVVAISSYIKRKKANIYRIMFYLSVVYIVVSVLLVLLAYYLIGLMF